MSAEERPERCVNPVGSGSGATMWGYDGGGNGPDWLDSQLFVLYISHYTKKTCRERQ